MIELASLIIEHNHIATIRCEYLNPTRVWRWHLFPTVLPYKDADTNPLEVLFRGVGFSDLLWRFVK